MAQRAGICIVCGIDASDQQQGAVASGSPSPLKFKVKHPACSPEGAKRIPGSRIPLRCIQATKCFVIRGGLLCPCQSVQESRPRDEGGSNPAGPAEPQTRIRIAQAAARCHSGVY